MVLLLLIGILFVAASVIYAKKLGRRLQVAKIGAKFIVEMVLFLWAAFLMGLYLGDYLRP